MLPIKGLYWYGSWELGRLQRHVYPVPDPRNPFLGVHVYAVSPAWTRSLAVADYVVERIEA